MTSTTAVCTARPAMCAPPTCRFALLLELRQFSKKYLALFLWMTSRSVPPRTRRAIMTTYVFMAPGGTDAESSPNGLLMSMVELLDACLKGIAEPTVPNPPRCSQCGAPGQIENSNYFA